MLGTERSAQLPGLARAEPGVPSEGSVAPEEGYKFSHFSTVEDKKQKCPNFAPTQAPSPDVTFSTF